MKSHRHIIIIATAASVMFCASCTPTDPRTELKKSNELMKLKQFDNALPGTRVCLDMNRDNVDAIVANAICVYNVLNRDPNECKNAKLNLMRATSTLAPERFDALYVYAWILMQDEDYSNALKIARRARDIYRAQQNQSIPKEEFCDTWDMKLAQRNMQYANLLLMIADICRHNGLAEGLPFFEVVLTIPAFAELPEVYIAYSQLFMTEQRTTEAYRVISKAMKKFPNDLACAYNLALLDEYRRSGVSKQSDAMKKVIEKYDRAMRMARQYGDDALANRIASRIALLRR